MSSIKTGAEEFIEYDVPQLEQPLDTAFSRKKLKKKLSRTFKDVEQII